MWDATWKKIVAVLVLAGVCALLLWSVWPEKVKSVTPDSDAVRLDSAVSDAPKEDIKVPPNKPPRALKKTKKVKKASRLPNHVFADDNKAILEVSKFRADYDGIYDVSAIYDIPTGNTSIHVAAEPLPWFALPNRKRIGFGHNLTTGENQIRLQYSGVQVKKFIGTVEATLRDSGRNEVVLYLDYEFR